MKEKRVKKSKAFYLICGLFIFFISFMSIGFALYNKMLPINGLVNIVAPGQLEITNIDENNLENIDSTIIDFEFKNFSFDIYPSSDNGKAIYKIDITNNSNTDYIFSGITLNNEEIDYKYDGFDSGEYILSGESISLNLEINLTTNENINITGTIDVTTNTEGNLLVVLDHNTGNLKKPNVREFYNLNVINTYAYRKSFVLNLSNTNFKIVDARGNEITSFVIDANSEETFGIYITYKDDAIFLTDTASTDVMVRSSNIQTFNAGNILFNVDIYVEPDTKPPVLSNPRLTMNNTVGSMTVEWDLTEEESSVSNYTIMLYNSKNKLIKNITTNNNLTYYEFTNISEDTYYAIIYGTDEFNNNGSNYTSSASNSGYAVKTSSVPMKWVFNVRHSVSNISYTGASTANINTTYTSQLSVNNNYTLPNNITVSMGGKNITNYTYRNGLVTIPNVNGDIVITATAEANNTCLVKGTKVLLSNGKYKNIEDITYSDLLTVYNFETGKITYEYPVWIEKEGKSDSYLKSTFSDGTILKTVGYHGIYNSDLNKFVDVLSDDYHIGSHVLKYENGKLKEVTVTNLEFVNENVSYYQVVSNVYYNIISNDIITTDGNTMFVNMYEFDNLKWKNKRNTSNLFSYDELKNIMPYYMFVGLRAYEMKILINNQIKDLNSFMKWVNNVNNNLLLKPNNLYVSIDDKKISIPFSSSITLPQNDSYYYNTVDNKIYKSGDVVKIDTSTHFISK